MQISKINVRLDLGLRKDILDCLLMKFQNQLFLEQFRTKSTFDVCCHFEILH